MHTEFPENFVDFAAYFFAAYTRLFVSQKCYSIERYFADYLRKKYLNFSGPSSPDLVI